MSKERRVYVVSKGQRATKQQNPKSGWVEDIINSKWRERKHEEAEEAGGERGKKQRKQSG
jgi:hypothetical protein